jgi:hypothetical protein
LRRLVLVVLLCVGCERFNALRLEVIDPPDDPVTKSGGPAGFSCRFACPCSDGTPCSCLLFQTAAKYVRAAPLGIGLNPAFDGDHAIGSAVVDIMSIGAGPPDPNPLVVVGRCTMSPCAPILRKCFALDLTSARAAVDKDGPNAKGSALDEILNQLHDQAALVTDNAPHVEVLVRMVTTTLTCDQIAQLPMRFADWPLDPTAKRYGASIFGCGYAGPFHLDRLQQLIVLGLPTLDSVNCVPQAAVCAADLDPRQAGPLINP